MLYKGLGIADTFFTKIKYVENISLTASALNLYPIYEWNANDLYDLNKTGTGKQCMYYDQICNPSSLYLRYLVTASKIKCRICSQSDSFAAGNVDVAVIPSQVPFASTSWTSIDDVIANKSSRTTSVVRYDNAGVKYLNHYAQTKKVLDIKDMKDNLNTCGAYYNQAPSNLWYWIIIAQGMDRSSTSATVNVRVELTSYVMFYTPTEPAQS